MFVYGPWTDKKRKKKKRSGIQSCCATKKFRVKSFKKHNRIYVLLSRSSQAGPVCTAIANLWASCMSIKKTPKQLVRRGETPRCLLTWKQSQTFHRSQVVSPCRAVGDQSYQTWTEKQPLPAQTPNTGSTVINWLQDIFLCIPVNHNTLL